MSDLIQALWFFTPVGVANMAPIIANNIPALKKLNRPIDNGKSLRGKRILGDNKTYRGLLAGMGLAGAAGVLQQVIDLDIGSTGATYGVLSMVALSTALGFGALAGDSIKSFFKRQAGVAPGKNWLLFDQLDYILGGFLVSAPFVSIDINIYAQITIIAVIIHPIANLIGWMLKLKSKPF